LDILTKGQKQQAKDEERGAQIQAEKDHKDQVHKRAQNFINDEIAENLFKDKVVDFEKKGFESFNYYVDLKDFEEDLPGGVVPLPEDYEIPQKWNKDTKQLEDVVYTLNQALRTKPLREYVQRILNEHFPGITVRIFAEDFKNDQGDPNKFTIKLKNANGKPKEKRNNSSAVTLADFCPPQQKK
jgi:hypothetical protein